MYKLAIKKSARKELDNLLDQIFLKVDKSMLSLKDNPFPYPQAKKLKGENKKRCLNKKEDSETFAVQHL
jgi:mRNA-degrading endonuclease RelE of RelBE toxin-antitoxin system